MDVELKNIVKSSGLTFKNWYNQIYLRSDHWKRLREAKFAISGKSCQQCGGLKNIQVHHLAYRNIFDVGVIDLLVVCGTCHERLHDGEYTSPKAARMPGKTKKIKQPKSPSKVDGVKLLRNGRVSLPDLRKTKEARLNPKAKTQQVERPVYFPAKTDGKIVQVTLEDFKAIANIHGAWHSDQLRIMGVRMKAGWLKNWKNPIISYPDWELVERITRKGAM